MSYEGIVSYCKRNTKNIFSAVLVPDILLELSKRGNYKRSIYRRCSNEVSNSKKSFQRLLNHHLCVNTSLVEQQDCCSKWRVSLNALKRVPSLIDVVFLIKRSVSISSWFINLQPVFKLIFSTFSK